MSDRPTPAPTDDPRSLTDSPWFWLALFAAMAIVGALVIQPKFARRQGRIEQRYENRLQAQASRQAAGERDQPESLGVEMRDVRPRSSLLPLLFLLLTLMLVAGGGLFWTRRINRSRASGPP